MKPEHSYLVEFLEYWRGKCDGRAMPARADIDPLEIPRLLPYVYLVDVLDDPPVSEDGRRVTLLFGAAVHLRDCTPLFPAGAAAGARESL